MSKNEKAYDICTNEKAITGTAQTDSSDVCLFSFPPCVCVLCREECRRVRGGCQIFLVPSWHEDGSEIRVDQSRLQWDNLNKLYKPNPVILQKLLIPACLPLYTYLGPPSQQSMQKALQSCWGYHDHHIQVLNPPQPVLFHKGQINLAQALDTFRLIDIYTTIYNCGN